MRVTAGDRYTQAVAVSRAAFPDGARTVVVASAARTSDAHVAAFVAGAIGAPLLYVDTRSVRSSTLSEVSRLAPDRVVIVGSPRSVTSDVADRLGRGREVTRIDGGSVYSLSQTALPAARDTARTVYMIDGRQLASAPTAAAAGAALGGGFLVVDGSISRPSDGTIRSLRAVGAREVVFANGASSLTSAYADNLRRAGFTVRRLAGADRTAIAISAAREYPSTTSRGIIAALEHAPSFGSAVATALAGATRQPFYFALERCTTNATAAEMARRGDTPLVIGPTSQLRTAVTTGDGCSRVREDREAELRSSLRAVLARHASSAFTVSVRELDGLSEVVTIGGAERREPASMMKLYAAWATYKRVERGEASLSTRLRSGLTVDQCLRELIFVSDNLCHDDLVHWIGVSRLNRQIAAAGFSRTAYGSVAPGHAVLYAGNRTTADDLSSFLKQLNEGRLLNRTHTAALKNLMHKQVFRSRIPDGIPPGIYQASKPGSLWMSGRLMQSDSAIVSGTRGRFVISVIGGPGASKAGIREIARTVYMHFNGYFSRTADNPELQVRTTRSTPWRNSPGGAIAGTISRGTALEVIESQRHWYKVRHGSRHVWIWYQNVGLNLG